MHVFTDISILVNSKYMIVSLSLSPSPPLSLSLYIWLLLSSDGYRNQLSYPSSRMRCLKFLYALNLFLNLLFHVVVFIFLFKLLFQVDSILGDRFPTIGDMKKLKYTARVINEVRRLMLFFFLSFWSVSFQFMHSKLFFLIKFFVVSKAISTTTCPNSSLSWGWRAWKVPNKKVISW